MEGQGTTAGDSKRQRGRRPQEYLSLHTHGLLEGRAIGGEAPLVPPAQAKHDRVLLVWSTGSRGKPPVIYESRGGHACYHEGSMNRHHLQPQSPQRSAQRGALQPSTTRCCSHCPGNTHALMLPLTNVSGTIQNFLKLTATSQGPATRSSLHHLPVGPCHCQRPSNQALATSPAHCLPPPWKLVPHPIKWITACTH